MKRWRRFLTLFLLCTALVWWVGRDFVNRNFGLWPAVRNPALLVSDCERLLQAIPPKLATTAGDSGIDLPKSEWPASIAALQPRAVTLFPDTVCILISTGGIGAAYGYLVIPSEPNGLLFERYFTTRPYKHGIYFWESQT